MKISINPKEYLFKTYGAGQKKGLVMLKKGLELLGNPQEKIRIIHLAGTNGKGSTCAMLGSILRSQGYTVGQFTSPHLEVINERFTINGQQISDEDFNKHTKKIIEMSNLLLKEGENFSYFEILTLIAFLYFAEKRVDFLLLEVGIGGRLDSTNVISSPILSIITAIGMDHMDLLGDTLEEIADQKAGIIKPNRPVVLSENRPSVVDVVKGVAKENNAKFYYAEDLKVKIIALGIGGTFFEARHSYFGKIDIKLNLLGEYQVDNARTAIMAAITLNGLGIRIEKDAIITGLRSVVWPGRMEIAGKSPLILLEGAHNLQGAQKVERFLAGQSAKGMFAGGITLIVAIFSDKQYKEIVRTFLKIADRVIFTLPDYGLRAVDPKELSEIAGHLGKNSSRFDNSKDAFVHAKRVTPVNGLIFCTGSLYLVGDIRSLINKEAKA